MDYPNMLHYIDMLLKYGSFTKAAKALFISQPHLTQVIKKTEQSLGVEIIDRHGASLQLTHAGKIYYNYLKSLEQGHEAFKSTLSEYGKPENEVIRIGVFPALGTYLLPLFLPAFANSYPTTKVMIEETWPAKNEQKLLDEKIDFFIGQNPETVTTNLAIYEAGKQNYYILIPNTSKLYCPDKHILKEGSIDIKEILKERLVLTTKGGAIRRHVDYLIRKYRINPKIAIETATIYTVIALAKNGAGVTIAPEPLLDLSEKGLYNLYPLPEELIYLSYFISHLPSRKLSDTEKQLIQHFLNALSFSCGSQEK